MSLVKTTAAWKALPLSWSGGTLNAEPAGWQDVAFDDSGWEDVHVVVDGVLSYWTPNSHSADAIVPPSTKDTPRLRDAVWIARVEFDLLVAGGDCTLESNSDDGREIWVNGHKVVDDPTIGGDIPATITVSGADLVVGTNCLAIKITNKALGGDPNAWTDNPSMGMVSLEAPDEPSPAEAWDVYAADDLLGPVLLTLGAAKGRWIRSELNGLGEGGFTINRHEAEVDEDIFAEGNMVKVRIPDCGPDYLDGFILGADNDFALLSARSGQGGEDLVFHGDGALSYLDRARMTPCAFSLDTLLTGLWTKLWATTAVNRPAGVAFDSAEPGFIYVGGLGSRKIRKLDQATLEVVSSSPALWSGAGKYLGGISFDPDDASIVWVLEIPWLSGSSANTKIRKVRRSDWVILATYDLGDDVQLTDIRVDGDYVWTTRYDNDRIQQRDKSDPTTVTHSSTITFKGKVQRKPNGIAINGTKVAYWFGGDGGGGTGRALVADTSAYTTITGVQDTKNVSAFGGEWTTEGGEDFLYTVNYLLGKTSKYQLTDATPLCADDSGTFHPEQVSPGALAWRVLVEITHPDRPTQPCPELSYDFTEDADSNGTPWPARTSTEEFTWRVGDRAYSEVLSRLIPAGVTFDLDVNTMTLHAYVDADFGTDRTSATFASGKVRFAEGVNLGVNGDLSRRDNRGQPDTDMTVAGDGGVYGTAELAGRYVREGFMQVTGPTTVAVLDAIGDDELARQRLVADALGFETLWGDSEDPAAGELVGRYMLKRHVWKGDLVRVDMVAGEFAYDEVDFRVYGTLITERDGKQATPGGPVTPGWRSAIDLGSKYKIPPPIESVPGEGSTGSGSGGGSAGGGSTVITSIPLTFTDPDRGVSIPRVTEVRAAGVTSPSPGVAVIPSGSAVSDPPLLEELLTDETDTTKVPHPDGTGGVVWVAMAGGLVPWVVVTDPAYGATGDGTTDDTAACNLAHAALNAAGGGVLYYPRGNYKCTAGLTTITVTALILGDGHGYADSHGDGGTEVRQASSTAKLFTVAATGTRFLNIGIRCTAATPTAGSGINAQADFIRYDNVAVSNFYDCVDHEAGGAWKMDGCWIVGAVRYGVRVRNTSSPDGGDQAITNSWFYADQRNGSAAIRLETGGGTKIIGNKFNTFVSGHRWVRAIDVAPTDTTTILIVEGNSIENYSGDGVHYDDSTSGGSWDQLIVVNNQFGQYGNGTGKAISIDGANDVHVGGGVFRADTGTPTAISLSNGTGALVEPFVNHGFGTLLATSSYTSVDDRTTASSGAPPAADYLVGTAQAGLSAEIVVGTTPGGELGGTWPSPTVDATHSGSAHADFIAKAIVDAKGDLVAATAADTVARVPVGTDGQLLKADSAAAAGVSWVDAPTSSGTSFVVIGQEERVADGVTTTWTLDNDFEENSLSARNLTTGHVLSVTEVLPNQVTVPAGTAGDRIAFGYAASVA